MLARSDRTPPKQFDEYRLVRPLGEGSMGQVFLCQDTALDRLVAVKFIRGLASDRQTRVRFWQEARAAARLTHPNIVSVYRLGEFDGQPYMVSEYIEGQSLLALPLPLAWMEVAQIGRGIALGLAAAHQRGVLHRDIKPANIMLASDGSVKILDFGLAKLMEPLSLEPGPSEQDREDQDLPEERPPIAVPSAAVDLAQTAPGSVPPLQLAVDRSGERPESTRGHAAPGLTQTGVMMGTPYYMAPEAWRGEPATRRTDLYSFGVVLYELLAGHPPYHASEMARLRELVLGGTPFEPVQRHAPDVNPQLAALIERCIQRDPDSRFDSMDEVCERLAKLLAGVPTPAAAPPGRPLTSRRWVHVSAMGLISCALAGSALHYLRNRSPQKMVTVRGGTFLMGSSAAEIESAYLWCRGAIGSEQCERQTYDRESPQRQVTVSSFRIDRTEVTNAEFAAWLNVQPGLRLLDSRKVMQDGVLLADIYPTFQPFYGISHDPSSGRYFAPPGLDRKPVTQVTWIGAMRFCRAQNKRLPTEAEWEYAARGPQSRRFPWGFSAPACDGVVLGRQPSDACRSMSPGPLDVASAWQDRTPEGVYDLAGNVMEWVLDRYVPTYPACAAPCRDPVEGGADESGSTERVMRGGDWEQPLAVGRAASRSRWRQDSALLNVGFRCAAPALP